MWLGHLISYLSCVNSSGIALTGISPNTSSAYVEKKTSTEHHLPPGKKRREGKRGCIYIGPDLLSRFEIQTGTKGPQTWRRWRTHFSRGSYNRPRLMILCRGRNLGTFYAAALSMPRQRIHFVFFYLFLLFI